MRKRGGKIAFPKRFYFFNFWGVGGYVVTYNFGKEKHPCKIELNKKCFPAAGEVVPEVNNLLHKA